MWIHGKWCICSQVDCPFQVKNFKWPKCEAHWLQFSPLNLNWSCKTIQEIWIYIKPDGSIYEKEFFWFRFIETQTGVYWFHLKFLFWCHFLAWRMPFLITILIWMWIWMYVRSWANRNSARQPSPHLFDQNSQWSIVMLLGVQISIPATIIVLNSQIVNIKSGRKLSSTSCLGVMSTGNPNRNSMQVRKPTSLCMYMTTTPWKTPGNNRPGQSSPNQEKHRVLCVQVTRASQSVEGRIEI